MDIIKAFDKVWYPGLIYKIGIGIIKKYTFLINDFNTERMMQFKRGNETSEKKPFRAGVPPGVVLSPIHIHFRHTHQQKQKKVAFRRQNHISTFKKQKLQRKIPPASNRRQKQLFITMENQNQCRKMRSDKLQQ